MTASTRTLPSAQALSITLRNPYWNGLRTMPGPVDRG